LGSVVELKRCESGELKADGVDLGVTLRVYNLCFWIGARHAYVFLPVEGWAVGLVKWSGEYEIYAEECSGYFKPVLEEVLGLHEDLSSFHTLAKRDPLLGDFVTTYPGWRLRTTSPWWALVTGACQQNASFRQGWSMLHRIVLNYGRRLRVGDVEIPAPPSPRDVVERPELLVESGVGYRAKTILNAARAILNGLLGDLHGVGDPVEVERLLRRIKGVGPYTARLAMALVLRRYELPPIDRWLRRIISVVYEVDEKYAEEHWSERWGRYAGLASIAVTIALDAEPLTQALERVRSRRLLPDLYKFPSPFNMEGFCSELRS
jgi:N-glycosylase/DNA lyase